MRSRHSTPYRYTEYERIARKILDRYWRELRSEYWLLGGVIPDNNKRYFAYARLLILLAENMSISHTCVSRFIYGLPNGQGL